MENEAIKWAGYAVAHMASKDQKNALTCLEFAVEALRKEENK